jgi:hypothetical protein
MPLIIDTFNVLHVTGVLPPDLAGLDAAGLAALIAKSRYRHEPTTLVCDGVAPPEDPAARRPDAAFTVLHSGAHVSADDLIARLVARSTAPRRLIVVSTDRAVAGNARRAGCRVLRSDAFLGQLVDDAERPGQRPRTDRPTSVSSGQVEKWMRVFGLDAVPIDGTPDDEPPVPSGRDDDVAAPARPVDANGPVAPETTAGPGSGPEPPRTNLPEEIVAEAERLWEQELGPRPADEETDR